MTRRFSRRRAVVSFLVVVLCAGCGGGDGPSSDALEPNVGSLPSLIQSLKHRAPSSRSRAAVAIGRMGPVAKEAVPALTAALKDRDVGVRAASAHALGKIGPDAKNALKDLQGLMKQGPLRDVAAEAVKQIGESK